MKENGDLLQRFTSGTRVNRFPVKPKEQDVWPENVELSLGLSLNGRFGPEPQRHVADDNNNIKKIFRASSVTGGDLSLYYPSTTTEADRWKRKQLRFFRRLEAKRKRVEKLKNVGVVKRCLPSPAAMVRFTSTDETMPFVFTKGDGSVGKRIKGIVYRYGEDEEVRIVCVCHGRFLTPAEFVKHGGGGEVDHPLRHIVITS